jgi:hypothetical protein
MTERPQVPFTLSSSLIRKGASQMRWVLRLNDTNTFARPNKVLETAEPKGGSGRPTGKQILLAYLQLQPNHL